MQFAVEFCVAFAMLCALLLSLSNNELAENRGAVDRFIRSRRKLNAQPSSSMADRLARIRHARTVTLQKFCQPTLTLKRRVCVAISPSRGSDLGAGDRSRIKRTMKMGGEEERETLLQA